MNFKIDKNKINWDELRKKVDKDLQDSIDEEVSITKDIEEKEGRSPGIINIRSKIKIKGPHDALFFEDQDSEEDQDYEDEGGELPDITQDQISKIAWNNNDSTPNYWGISSDSDMFRRSTPIEPDPYMKRILHRAQNPDMYEDLYERIEEGYPTNVPKEYKIDTCYLDKKDKKIDNIENKEVKDRTLEEHLYLIKNKYNGSVRDYLLSMGPFKEDEEDGYEEEEVEDEDTYSLTCLHVEDDDNEADVYIYPIDEDQELVLCPDCNAKLSSQVLEQLALEIFSK